MLPPPLQDILDEAGRAQALGDLPGLVKVLDRFDGEVEKAGLRLKPVAARSWPLRLSALRSAGKPEQVLAAGSRLARVARKRKWTRALGQVLAIMGRGALDLSDFSRARMWFEEAFAAADSVGDDSLRAEALLGSATVWELQGEVKRFREVAEQARPYAERGDDLVVRAEVFTTLGRALNRSGLKGGEAHLIAAESLLEQANAHVSLLKNLLDHLVLPMSVGDLESAEALMKRAEKLANVIYDRQIKGRVLLDRGELLRMQGHTTSAIACYRNALKLVPAGHPVARVAQLNLALARILDGKADDVKADIPALLEVTRGHALFHGLAHLMALAVGPRERRTTEDDLWIAHGTPARLPLRGAGGDPDIDALARSAARRMLGRADPVQAGRAALVAGIAGSPDDGLIRAIRHARGAVPIGPFLALQRIGSGGMGEVYLGRHVDSDLPAAIKVVNPEMSKSETAYQSFENELRAVAALSHPNIVRLLDHGRAGRAASWLTGGRIAPESPYLALEYVRGGPISRWMGKMTWPQIRKVLTDLLGALAHAHARRVLHLDLKPDNVLLNEPGDPEAGVRLTDFGLALLRAQNREAMAGTLHFMAPEQFVGKELGTYSDLYALGCMGWGMVTNRAPFESDDKIEMQSLHALAPLPDFEPLMEVPDGLHGWLCKLLEKNPRDRFTRASDALDALDALSPDRRIPPDPTTRSSLMVADAGLALAQERQPRLVGHRAVRDTLWKALITCRDRRRPTAVELHGPLGSGRTAVATWLATRAHEEGLAEVVWHDAEDGLAALIDGPPPVSAGSLALRLLNTLNATRQKRVAVIVCQAEDPALPEVLDILLREADGPLFFVVRTPPGRLRRNRAIQRLELSPLGPEEMRSLIRSLIALTPALEERLLTFSEGNGGLALAIVRSLATSGDLRPSKDGWGSPHLHAFRVPTAVRHALEPVLRAIGHDAARWEAIQLAAALGRSFDLELWTALSSSAPQLLPALEEALILRRREGQVEWIQPAARALITQDRSIRVAHGRVAEHLRDAGGVPAAVGRHFAAAHLYADAHRPLLDAVAKALEMQDDALARTLLDEWRDVLDRLAVSAKDPRRLAGKRFEGRLSSPAPPRPGGSS